MTSSNRRSLAKRIPPKSSIEWLSHDARKKHRDAISVLTKLATTLENTPELITPEQDRVLDQLTQSKAMDTRLNAAWDILERTEETYLSKLIAMAPHDLTAYHEAMNPHEPPAYHHIHMCEQLMKVEAGEVMTLVLSYPPGSAKALALDTPIPTPGSWTTMGDLKVGDRIAGDDGIACNVTWVSPVYRNRKVYAVEPHSDIPDVIVADATHEWKLKDGSIVETQAIANDGGRAILIDGTPITVTFKGYADTKCIEVDSPTHLFLCGKSMIPTHNSTYSSRSFVQWFMGRNPNKRVFAVGHSSKFVEDEFSKPNRSALQNEIYARIFPDVMLDDNEKSASFWRLDGWRGLYNARGALANTAGIRANLIAADDLYRVAADALSPTVRGNIQRWWSADVMTRRLPGCPIVLVNTRWHSQDVAGKIDSMNKENPQAVPQPCVVINIPAEAKENDPLGRKPGEWLWEEFYGKEHYETLRADMATSLWSALYQGEPVDKQGSFIAEDSFKRYDKAPVNKPGEPKQWVKCVMSIDTAGKGSERSNNTAILIFRQGIDGIHYLVHAWTGKYAMDDIVKLISQLMTEYQVDYALIEDTGMGMQINQNMKDKFPSPIIPVPVSGKGSKDFRFDAATPWINSGKVLFPKAAPWLPTLIAELVAYPSDVDDQVDAFSQYTAHSLTRKVGGVKKLRMGY